MITFKSQVQKMCAGIASEFPGWAFSGEQFQNKTLGFVEMFVRPFSAFKRGMCQVTPWAAVNDKKVSKLYTQLLGNKSYGISMLMFQRISEDYRGPSAVWSINAQKMPFIPTSKGPIDWPANWIDLTEAPVYLRKVLTDGISFLNEYYDFSSEENFLSHLPRSEKVWIQGGMNGTAAIMQCLAHVVLGDFDFVEWYLSDAVKTVYPKPVEEIDLILAKLPEFKQRYAETGKVV